MYKYEIPIFVWEKDFSDVKNMCTINKLFLPFS